MNTTIHLEGNDETAKLIVRASFPGYSGRKFKVEIHKNDSKFEIDLGMSGGTFSRFAFVKLDTMTGVNVNNMGQLTNYFGNGFNRMPTPFQMPEGFAIVEHSHFCGSDMGITIHLLEANATKFIAAPVDLTTLEIGVLKATRSLKSSYMGRTRQQESGIALADWNAASVTLKAKGFLNKVGAITPAGKNAIANERSY
jgi:hypothetical protein